MRVRFLLDENLSPRLKAALKRLDVQIDVLRIGDEGTIPLGTLDPELLQYLATSQRLLVTDNRSTLPGHLAEYYAASTAPHWGIIWVRPDTTMRELAAELHLIWVASEAEEWLDRTDWVPF
ncbi:MAG: DUF5615 family PIN-like protein [Chloroflexi bacterium]|nr:DUF5615 family PIN-like protein [Chloroflexota bacterium]MCI0575088.1 DUF5615 family PIN-like protein [Chloroflexota bacterium]MCI0643666.1 DUF5615 family PIN-like protein [Chloroflexota bacterium]MCI0729902.1 DUF5615 family PIN-like protein [Chloroflexota bacterium]